ncbi:MAG: response regulator, partial [Myxococcales bacterium]|nr:response regulator [Myxococcales bacterium]
RTRPRSRVYLPVMCHERCVGAFGLASVRPQAFSQADIVLLSFVCNIAGVVYAQILAREHERALETRLLQAQKQEALGMLAGSVAHDFNNLLTIIIGHIELLLLDSEDETTTADLESALHAANRASGLATRLRSMSRQQAPAPKQHDLRELIAGLESMLRSVLGERWPLQIETEDESAGAYLVRVDGSEIEQAIINLVLNARDASEDGAPITLSLARRELDAGDDGREQAGDHVELCVRDRGSGMDEHTRARIFEPFFTTKSRELGTGLGLPTVRSIVRRYRGRITVDSQPGRGSCFHLYFPRCAPPSAGDDASPTREPSLPREHAPRRLRVLIAEDEPYLRLLLVRIVTGAGHEATAVDDGRQALAEVVRQESPFELLITDLRMPVMNGKELLEAVERESPSTRALVISGFASDIELQSQLRAERSYELLWKPFTPAQILEAIDRVTSPA